MRNSFLEQLKKNNLLWKVKLLTPYFKKKEKVLDFGCGDLTMAKGLKEKRFFLEITGVDVINHQDKIKDIPLVIYDGKKLPFKNEAFETVIAFYVFHHCQDVWESFSECLRVGKRLLFIEAIPRNKFEVYLMSLMDWLYNLWKPKTIPLTYQFFSLEKWKQMIKEQKVKSAFKKEVKNSFFAFLPIGKTFLFEIKK